MTLHPVVPARALVRFFAALLAVLLSIPLLHAQGPITENPEGAVRLKRIWYLKGPGIIGKFVGGAAGGVGDVNEDGFDDFFVQVAQDWQLFLGGETISMTPAWIHYSTQLYVDGVPPVVGDFLGNGSRLIGLPDARCNSTNGVCIVRIYFYQPDRDSLLKSTSYLLDLGNVQRVNYSVIATDLDNDGDDELIIMTTDDGHYTKVRIYAGGPDFDLSQPTLVMTDDGDVNLRAYGARMHVSDIDGDGLKDLILGFNYPTGAKLKFWWGGNSSPWNLTNQPDRVVSTPTIPGRPSYFLFEELRDYNGDSLYDFISTPFPAGNYLWLSRRDGSQRTRSFDSTDFDLYFPGYYESGNYGYVADSNRRYQILSLVPTNGAHDDYLFMGGASGPNFTYDGIYGGGDGPLGGGTAAGDINGDGWEDRIVASDGYGGPGVGAAMILAGGPYIPNDDPTSHVEVLPSAEHVRSFWVWPNPVQEVLHLAWRGDFKNPPVKARLYDMSGRLNAETHLQSWTGTIDWRVEYLTTGVYVLSILDKQGAILSTTSLLKE